MFPWTESEFKGVNRIQRAAIVFSLAAVFFCFPTISVAKDARSIWKPLTDRLVEDGYDQRYITSLFSRNSLSFSPELMARKMNVLLETKLSMVRPESPQKPEVIGRYLNPILLAGAYAFYREHRELLAEIETRYGVPGVVLTALFLVETKLGTQVGKDNAMIILANMALAHDFDLIKPYIKPADIPDEVQVWLIRRTEQKANWAYEELKSLISYARNNGQDPLGIPSSMYGAIGLCQFIPSSALHYGVDGTGDGRVDLFDTADALYSMANFLKSHGWKQDLDQQAQLKVVYRYNHSESYSLTILAVADKLKKTDEFFGN